MTGSLRAEDLTSLPPREWDELAVRSVGGEALQSHAWGELKRRNGWEVRRYRLEADGTPVGVASVQERSPLPARLRRVPIAGPIAGRAAGRVLYAPTGPVVWSDEPTARANALRALHGLAARRRAALVIVDPVWELTPTTEAMLEGAGFTAARRQVQVSRTGMIVPLAEEEAAQHARIGSSVAWNINRARRKGVVTHRVSAESPPDERSTALARFDDILVATARRHGLHLRDKPYRLDAARSVLEAGAASLWFARVGDADVAATFVHHCGRRLVSFQSGEPDVEKRNRLPANYVLQWDIMRWAATCGFTEYDLGGVDTAAAPGIPQDESHPLWGLFQFKLQWGARPVVYVGAREHAPSGVRAAAFRAVRRVALPRAIGTASATHPR